MEKRKGNPSLEARRKNAARLLLIALLSLCAGCVALQAVEILLARLPHPVMIQAEDEPFLLSIEPDGRMDINLAGLQDLQQVSGIGPTLAQRILDTREVYGSFRFLEEVKDVSGIGEKRFEAIRELFYCPLP